MKIVICVLLLVSEILASCHNKWDPYICCYPPPRCCPEPEKPKTLPRDSLVEQMPPVFTLGTKFAVSPTPGIHRSDIYMFVAPAAHTVVTITSESGFENFTIEINANNAPSPLRAISGRAWITASTGIMLVKYVTSDKESDKGGPAMTVVTPIEQFIDDYDFMVPSGFTSYLTLTVPSGSERTIEIDEAPVIAANWQPIPGSTPPMVSAYFVLSSGFHNIEQEDEVLYGAQLFASKSNGCAVAYSLGRCLTTINHPFFPAPSEPECTVSSMGIQFVVAFLAPIQQDTMLELLIASPDGNANSMQVQITAPLDTEGFSTTVTVSSAQAVSVSIPSRLSMSTPGRSNKAILITSPYPVTVHALHQGANACGGMLLLPIEGLNTQYAAVSWLQPTKASEMVIVATEDNTSVYIILPENNGVNVLFEGTFYGDGEWIQFNLNAYEAVKLRESKGKGLSGTLVQASNKVAIFSGNRDAAVTTAGEFVYKVDLSNGTSFDIRMTLSSESRSFFDYMLEAISSDTRFRFTAEFGSHLGYLVTELSGLLSADNMFWAFLMTTFSGDCLMNVGVKNYAPVDGDHMTLKYAPFDIFSTVPNCETGETESHN